MDEPAFDANTDVLVVVDPGAERLLWVPRDLWCPQLRHRVNRAYAMGGEETLRAALAAHRILAEHTLVAGRQAAERCLDHVRVTVPVPSPIELWYPQVRGSRIEEGRRPVRFDPPAAELSGERVHEWIGARYSPAGSGSDLHRIRRQQTLLIALLEQQPEFAARVAED